jgi:hypothetical protein
VNAHLAAARKLRESRKGVGCKSSRRRMAHKKIVSVVETLSVDGEHTRIFFSMRRSHIMIYACALLLISVAADKGILIIFQIRKAAKTTAFCAIRM